MQFVILGLLLSGPLSLYDLHKHFTAGISLFYSASFGSIQRALGQLNDSGLVTVSAVAGSRRNKKLYEIAPAGRAAWREWMLAPVEGSAVEATLLAKVFLLGRMPDASERIRTLDALDARITHDLGVLNDLAATLDATPVPDSRHAEGEFQRATLDYGIRSHELAAQWLADVRAMVAR